MFSLFVLLMLPADREAFDELAFMNPPAAASTAEAEVHAHSLSVFAEAVMARLNQFPESLPRYPNAVTVATLDQNPRYAPVLPASYNPTMPWRAYLLPVKEAGSGVAATETDPGIGAVVAYVNQANLPRTMRPVDIARGLRLTAGGQVTVGLLSQGSLLTDSFTHPGVERGFGRLRGLPFDQTTQNAPAIVICLSQEYCGAG
ncbi:MAG: hypothetical protein KI792_10295 [Alphaproteobacteria bacterium]|nr:hypothetical protein [Alphaproteobacteria bacterium SS10]